jgi:hypothetical protein
VAVLFQVLAVLTAFLAAILWLKSAFVRMPEVFATAIARPTGASGRPLGGDPLGGTYLGQAYSEDLTQLGRQLRLQAKWSAAAACCAGVSVLFQGIAAIYG